MSSEASLSDLQIFYYRMKQKALKLINLKILTILFFILLFSLYITVEKYLLTELKLKNTEISENIASNIEGIENEIDHKLSIISLFVEKEFLNTPFSKEKLKVLVKKLKISGIDIYNKNGFMVFTDRDVLDKNFPNKFYREISIIDLKQCETQLCGEKLCRTKEYEITNCKIRRKVVNDAILDQNTNYLMPMVFMFHHKGVRVPVKWVHLYSGNLQKIISIVYNDFEIDEILESSLKINSSLKYIAVKDGSGNLITEYGNKSNNNINILTPFGKVWHFHVEGKKVDYSYVLETEFSKNYHSNTIIIIRILFMLIAVLILLITIFSSNLIRLKEKGIKMLKEMIK